MVHERHKYKVLKNARVLQWILYQSGSDQLSPPAHDSSGGRCTDGRQSAATRTRFTPALLLTVFLDTDRLYLSFPFAYICLEEIHIVCDICSPSGLQQSDDK